MCNFFSFSIDRNRNVYALLGKDRANALLKGENPDSHTYISLFHKINEDQTWKFELPLNIDEIKMKLENGEDISELVSIRNLKYDGGLPEEELKSSHENAIRAFLDNIDWENDVIKPHLHPEEYAGGIYKRMTELKKWLDGDGTGRRAMIVYREQVALIEKMLHTTLYLNIESRKIDTRHEHEWAQQTVQKYGDIDNAKELFLAITKRKYYDNETGEIKTRIRFVISDFEDWRE